MNKPKLSHYLEVNKESDKGELCVIVHNTISLIDGTCCDNHDTDLSIIGVASMESFWLSQKQKKARVSDRIIGEISKEIKFTY